MRAFTLRLPDDLVQALDERLQYERIRADRPTLSRTELIVRLLDQSVTANPACLLSPHECVALVDWACRVPDNFDWRAALLDDRAYLSLTAGWEATSAIEHLDLIRSRYYDQLEQLLELFPPAVRELKTLVDKILDK